jgi:cephalosporin-C deacetylase-like acetyl esterase
MLRAVLLLLAGAASLSAQASEQAILARIDPPLRAHTPRVALTGTALLELPPNLFELQQRQIQDYFLRQIAVTPAWRDELWKDYPGHVAERRRRLAVMLGSVDVLQPAAQFALLASWSDLRIEELRAPVEGGHFAHALVLIPSGGATRKPVLIVIGPEDQTAERFAGIEEGRTPATWLLSLLARDVVLCLPVMVERTADHPLSERLRASERFPLQDRRRILHRLGFVTGRTLTGMEADQVRALVHALSAREEVDPERIGVVGRNQGGMTALFAAALDERIRLAGVSGYFSAREECWREPVDRMIYGQLLEFGDAELAALVAPRPLVLDTAAGTIEFERARRYFERQNASEQLRFIAGGFEDLALECARLLGAPEAATPRELPGRLSAVEIQERRNRHFEALLAHLRRRAEASEEVRRRRWNLAGTAPEARQAKAAALVEELRRLVGETPADGASPNPRTRLIKVTDRYVAFDVMLDVVQGVEAYGQLLVPRNAGGRLPAVIAQHGLGGRPKDVTLQGDDPDNVYHGFAARLAEAGYVVFAPYVTVPIPQAELINPLVRQAAALGRMRTSIEVAKLRRIIDFLESLEFVDRDRIGYYGLSYGGYSAIWMAPLEPRLRATIISGHFNDWREKITNELERTSYLFHVDEDFFNWDVLGRFSHVELLAALYPRAVMVEYALRDGTTFPAWHERAWSEVAAITRAWEAEDRIVRDRFEGRHEIHGIGALEFLDRWLRPERAAGRDYEYRLWPSLQWLPGISDAAPDTLPFLTHQLDARPGSWIRGSLRTEGPFGGLSFRLARTGDPGNLLVRYGTRPGGEELGTARVAVGDVHPLFDLWVDAPVPVRQLEPGATVWFELRAERGQAPADYFTVFGPRPLGGVRLAPEFALSFRPIGRRPSGREERFEFMRRLLGPYQPSAPGAASSGRFEIRMPRPATAVVEQAAAHLRELLSAWGASVGRGGRPIELELSPSGPPDEGFRIEIGAAGIRIASSRPRGLLRGVYELERQIQLARSLELAPGRIELRPRFPIRITTAPVPGGDRYTETSREPLYTDGLLRRISRDGFNGIWVWLNVEEAVIDSAVLPELNDAEARLRLARLSALARRAARYGIDVWVYLATGYNRHMPEWFYARRPELRGQGWGNPLCISQRLTREFYAETVRRIFERAPELAGLVVIYDSEGFFHCANEERNHSRCPRCRQRPREELTRDLLVLIRDAMLQAGGPEKRLIAWNYGYDTRWLERLFALLPKDIIHQCDFSKGGLVERDGIRHLTGDYNLTLVGPPDHWVEQYRITQKLGLKFIAKTEHAISQEFVFVPYIPAMEQWLARIRKMREFHLEGWFGNWSHYGYTPSPPPRLINRMSWDPEPAEPLEELARMEYGPEAAPSVLQAWRRFSEAIREFPYSDHVARVPGPLQKGPSHPFFLDASIASFGRWRSWQNDLEWTRPWGREVAAKYLRRVREGFAEGARLLERAPAAQSEYRIARTIVSALDTTLNLVEWIEARDRGAPPERLLEILERERANVEAILPILEADSRLGFASDGGGIIRGGLFTPELVRWKLGYLEDVMFRQIPARFGRLAVPPPDSDLARLLVAVR